MKIAVTATPCPPRMAPLLFQGELRDAFRQAAGFGCRGVEIHLRRVPDVDARLLRDLAAEFRLEIPALGTGLAAVEDGLTFADPDAGVRGRAVERVRGHIELAAGLGAAVIVGIMSGKLGAGPAPERAGRRARALDCLGEVCRAAAEAGVTVLLEPLNRYECDYLNTLAEAAAAAKEIGAPNLRLLADTFHMNMEEADMAASLREAGQLVGHVHLADTNRMAPGYGHLDIAAVLDALDAMGYRGYLSLEVLPLPDPCRAIRTAMNAVRAAGAGGQT